MVRCIGSLIAGFVITMACARSAVADDGAAKLYKSKCSSCHGKTAAGKKLKVKDWTDGKVLRGKSDAEIKKLVTTGVKGPDGKWAMAPFPKLSDADIASVTAYIRTLAKP